MWWKIYIWIYALISLIGVIGFFMYPSWSLSDWISIILFPILTVGCFVYVYKMRLWIPRVWQILFIVSMIELLLNVIYYYTPLEEFYELPAFLQYSTDADQFTIAISYLITAPIYYAVYKLGFSQKSKK